MVITTIIKPSAEGWRLSLKTILPTSPTPRPSTRMLPAGTVSSVLTPHHCQTQELFRFQNEYVIFRNSHTYCNVLVVYHVLVFTMHRYKILFTSACMFNSSSGVSRYVNISQCFVDYVCTRLKSSSIILAIGFSLPG